MWWLIIPVAIYSAGLSALWLLVRKSRLAAVPSGENNTAVSVIVACHNEEGNILRLLDCLANQNYPADKYEVIVVDDNSEDQTITAINDYVNKSGSSPGLILKLLKSTGSGKKSAVRQGIAEAKGDLIITTDADCTMGPRWICSYSACYEQCNPDMILGSVADITDKSFISLFAGYEFAALQGITEATALLGDPVMCNGANMGFGKSVYMKHSGELHNEVPSGDDMFLLHAVKRGGGKISYLGCAAAAVETAAAVSAAALLSQRARWASKAYLYRGPATLTLAAATAACNAATAATAIASCFIPGYLIVTTIMYALRVLPDYLIISYTLKKRKERMPLLTFVVMELIYPFYFIVVAFASLIPSMRQFSGHRHSA